MTILSLSLSATFPGAWTPRATRFAAVATLSPADDYGNATDGPSSTIFSIVPGAFLDIGGSVDLETTRSTLVTDLSFGATRLHDAAGLATIASYVNGFSYYTGDGPATLQVVTANGPWNRIKNIAISEVSTQGLTVNNFVDTSVETGDSAAHTIVVQNAKRGTVTAAGDTALRIHYLSNEYTWSNTFDVTLGNGANNVYIDPATSPDAALVATLEPMTFNTSPQNTRLDLTVGNGPNTIMTREASSNIRLGNGYDTVSVTDGHNEVWMGDGADEVDILSSPRQPSVGPIATDIGSDVVHIGKSQDRVFISDANPGTMPDTTIIVPKVVTITPLSTAVFLQYGHPAPYPSRDFIGGDWSHVTIEFQDFAPGSSISLWHQSGSFTLVATDSVDHTIREIGLQGATPTLAQLHSVFGHS